MFRDVNAVGDEKRLDWHRVVTRYRHLHSKKLAGERLVAHTLDCITRAGLARDLVCLDVWN
jgi:hypothetical protein